MNIKIDYDNINYTILKIKRYNILNDKLNEYFKLLILKDCIIEYLYDSDMYRAYELLRYLIEDVITSKLISAMHKLIDRYDEFYSKKIMILIKH